MATPRFELHDPDAERFCPECGGGFRHAVERCPRCRVPLVHREEAERLDGRRDPGASSPDVDPEVGDADALAANPAGPFEAVWMRSALEAEGIPCRVDGLVPQLGVAGGMARARVWVRESDLARAREVLARPADEADEAGSQEAAESDGFAAPEPDEEEERARHEYARARRLRYLRGVLLGSAAWGFLVGILALSGGLDVEGGVEIAVGSAFALLWLRSFRKPRTAFAAATILALASFVLLVSVSLIDPSEPASLREVFGSALLVVFLYWGWQSASEQSAGRAES